MTSKKPTDKKEHGSVETVPFQNAEEAWFWFIAAQQARLDGARFVAGQGACPRPCEPIDILKILDRLYRQRRLLRDHLLVLRHYGRRYLAPDFRRSKELRAAELWSEAMERIGVVLEAKNIIQAQSNAHESWFEEAMLYENYNMDLPAKPNKNTMSLIK